MPNRSCVALFAFSLCACSSVAGEPSAPAAPEVPGAAREPEGGRLSTFVEILIVDASRDQRASFRGRSIEDIAADTGVNVIANPHLIAQNHSIAQLNVEGLSVSLTPHVRSQDDVGLDLTLLYGLPHATKAMSLDTSVVVPRDETVIVGESAQGKSGRSRAILVRAWVIRTDEDLRRVFERKLQEKQARELGAR